MSISTKIQPSHLKRQAIVYVRQSTPKQVQCNSESTRRQYELANQAHEMGWPQALVTVIDDDLGFSGTSSVHRLGFQRLVATIGMGQVGLILVTEVSRLSRLNSDWHRVIELCAVFETLIADEDGFYDPRDPNDRLLLGLKGTLFAAELHILRARMRGNLLNKARRGELALRLPVGYRRLHDGTVVLDPDEQVCQVIRTVFDQFAQLRNARAVQRYFHGHHLTVPRLIQAGAERGAIRWVHPTYQMIYQILTSPVYAGVFVYGRRKTQVIPGDPPRVQSHRMPMEEWDIVIPDIYPAYIAYDQYRTNRQILQDNQYNFSQKRRGAPREGRGLLQGLVVCGRCGRRMTPSYGSDYEAYLCRREQMAYGDSQCQAFPMYALDHAVGNIFLEAIQPASLETSLSALTILEQERKGLDHQWQLRLERARYQAHLAQRQYDAVDPENRLVVRELERRWNDALAALEALESDYAVMQRTELAPLDEGEVEAIRRLASDLPTLWDAPTTTSQDRKRLLRLVIREITITPAPKRSVECVIFWVGGAMTSQRVTCRPLGWHCVTDPQVIQRIRELALVHPDHRIAEELNKQRLHTQTGKKWSYKRVLSIRKQHRIPTACPLAPGQSAPRGDGLVPVRTAAQWLHISPASIHLWASLGILASDQRVATSFRWVRVTPADIARLDGSAHCSALPTVADIMAEHHLSREQVWKLVRSGRYTAFRIPLGKNWQWRLKSVEAAEDPVRIQGVVT